MGTRNSHIGRYIGKLYNLQRRRLWKDTEGLSYSGTEMRVLSFLLGCEGPVFQRDIEEEFLLRASTVTELIKNLEEHGLVERKQFEEDARLKRIIPSSKALEEKTGIIGGITEFEKDIVAGIDRKDLEIFCRVAEKMIANLSRGRDMEETR